MGISLASVSRTEELSLGRNHITGCLPGASGARPVQRSLGSQEQWGAQMLLPSAAELSLPGAHCHTLTCADA